MTQGGLGVGGPRRGRAKVQALFVAAVAVAASVVMVAAMALWSAPAAGAVVCGPKMSAATSADHDDAVICYNTATAGSGPYTISVTANIAYTTGNFTPAIVQANAATLLTIDGNGFTVSGPGGQVNANDLFLIAGPGGVVFQDIIIDESAWDGIELAVGAGDVKIVDSTISRAGDDAVEVRGGSLSVTNSRLAAPHDNGLSSFGGSFSITNSTIVNAGDDGIESFGGSISVSDSTISGSRDDGVEVDAGSTSVSNSTISGSGDAGVELDGGFTTVSNSTVSTSGSIGVEESGGTGSVVSSVVTDGCLGSLSGSNNFTVSGGSCGTGSAVLIGTLGPLQANGCTVPTPAGCVETIALPASTNAIDAGDCTAVTVAVGVVSDLATDQRGQPRTPAVCDAGAYEVNNSNSVFCGGLLVTINMNTNGGIGAGTSGDDVILGTAAADLIIGSGGNDTICGGDGDDTLKGGPGSDTIFGDNGKDNIRGGGAADILDGGAGNDTIAGQGGPDTIDGGAGDDKIDGLGAKDVIDGGAGNDNISGQNGADTMTGGDGNDTIKGQTGPDIISGDNGNDTLQGGNGNDTLFGGAGANDKCAGNLGGNDMAERATCEQTPGVEALF